MMNDAAYRVHERTLIGGIDSYLMGLVHVRPYVTGRQREALETLAEQWIQEGGANAIESITSEWLSGYLALAEDPTETETALRDFYRWADRERLTERGPVAL